jgi:hypothetical protein
MQTYRNLSANSGVQAYEYGDDYIRVQFTSGSVYLYTAASAGAEAIEAMKTLADAGEGLNRYINQHVSQAFAQRER